MSFTESVLPNAILIFAEISPFQNLAHTSRVIPYAENYLLQNGIGVDPIEQIQRAYEDEKKQGDD